MEIVIVFQRPLFNQRFNIPGFSDYLTGEPNVGKGRKQ